MSELHHLERALLLALRNGEKSFKDLTNEGLDEASISRAANWLLARGYIRVEESRGRIIRIGPEGERFIKKGMPERALVNAALNSGKLPFSQAQKNSGLSQTDVSLAIGWARRKGWIQIQREGGQAIIVPKGEAEKGKDEELLERLFINPIKIDELSPEFKDALVSLEERPSVVIMEEILDRRISLTSLGKYLVDNLGGLQQEANQLTPELLVSGQWRQVEFRRYDIQAPVAKLSPGKKQPFLKFLDNVKRCLVAMGFKEMTGPSVELMFFNCDALYMPQDHPAREIHDVYYIKEPSEGDLNQYEVKLKNVKATHENGWTTGSTGWGGKFSLSESRHLVLRSQGTAISARKLVDKNLEIPGKYFSVARVYRPDVVDRTHLTEFHHLEGIILGEELTLQNLLGTLETFAKEIAGAEKIRFKPDYFPFTEPSVELTAYKEGSGWLEFGGAGMFRPEVTKPLGIEVPVIAWGLGVNIMFMMHSNITDIRQLFSQDLDWLREQKVT
ncbi:phenylalanine--tRNA ligase subunit alpha [Candidatus Bathyarchaeota archaeon]|nr:phenylalanine--tRNA ligase subunit alpha [Candidatus Bathyarchaeota archaeon]